MTEQRGGDRIRFGPFALDIAEGRLWRDGQSVPLRPKAWAVLCHLASHPQVLVSNDQLMDAAWPGVAVTPQTLTNVIRELRIALGDSPRAARYIETVHGRGYVFNASRPAPRHSVSGRPRRSPAVAAAGFLIGRDAELAHLRAALAEVAGGCSRVVFVHGEPGIGKTTLAEAFAESASADGAAQLARGNCIEQHGQGEPYLPLLQAIDELVGGGSARPVRAALRRYAPTWLLQLPWHMDNAEHGQLARTLRQTSTARMLREGLAFLDEISDHTPVILLLEDLHWSDLATLDFLAALARRQNGGAVLAVATYRQADAVAHAHPVGALARELVHAGRSSELALTPFTREAIATYLAARLGGDECRPKLVNHLEQQCAGNPLFLGSLLDRLIESGAIETDAGGWRLSASADALLPDLPQSLRDFVLRALEALPGEQRSIVEAAAVADSGAGLCAAEIAPVAGLPLIATEAACDELARVGRLLCRAPDPSAVAPRGYAFVHAAYRRVVYEQVAPLRRELLHREVALYLEARCVGAHSPIAAQLATHFERGGLPARAATYYAMAAGNAADRFAYRESVTYLRAALEQLARAGAAAGPEAGRLHLHTGMALAVAEGYAASASAEDFRRAHEIFAAVEDRSGMFLADTCLCCFALASGDMRTARVHADRLIERSRTDMAPMRALGLLWAGFTFAARGELNPALQLLRDAAAYPLPDVGTHPETDRVIQSQLAVVLSATADLRGAASHAAQALEMAHESGNTPELAHTWLLETERQVMLRDEPAARTAVATLTALAGENEIVSFLAFARFYGALLDNARPAAERAVEMRAAIVERRRIGDRWHESMLLALVAETELAAGHLAAAVAALDEAEAFVERSEERHYLAELYRLRGECAAESGRRDEAASWIERAVETAQAQGARLLELRAATAAVHRAADPAKARPRLAALLAALPDGPECPDAARARLLARAV